MKRAHALLAVGAALVLGAATAAGQPKAAAPKASASAAAPSASASAAPPAPPASAPLPAGHPSVDDDDAADDPHAKASPDPRFYTPPDDVVVDDPALPAGVIVVTIKDAQDRPIPRAPIALGVLHSSVAKGDTNEKVARDADASGSTRFEGLAFGTGHSYRVSTTRGPATYMRAPFGLSAAAGKRVTLHSYEVSNKVDDLPLAMQGMIYVTLREDSIQIEQLISVYNLGPVAWAADAPVALPKGFKAFNKQDTMDDARVEEVPGQGAALRGTFPPGRRDLDFRYQVPLDNATVQTLKIRLPPRVAQARVIAEASRAMTLEVSGFPTPRLESRDGKRLLVTEQQIARGAGGVSSIDLTLGGLPTPGPGRWIAVALAVMALGSGVYYFSQSGGSTVDEDARRDLGEAREALLGEIVALERAFKSGEIGPKTYNRVRVSLLDALARIVAMIEEAQPKTKPAPKRPRRRLEPST